MPACGCIVRNLLAFLTPMGYFHWCKFSWSIGFCLRRNFARQMFTIAIYQPVHFYSCGCIYTFVRQEASHEISENLHLVKIFCFTVFRYFIEIFDYFTLLVKVIANMSELKELMMSNCLIYQHPVTIPAYPRMSVSCCHHCHE